MVPSTPLPDKSYRVSLRKKLGRLLRDIPREAVRQVFGKRSSSRRTVYWSKDRRGKWVCHIPMYRGR